MSSASLLAALQLGDSAFPSGAFTQSYGLETLVSEKAVFNAAGVEEVLAAHLRHRLARADLPALLAAHQAAAASDTDLVRQIDDMLTATKMTREERQASQRVGARLIAEAKRLAPSPIFESGPCNGAVAFALAGCAMGLDARESATTYGYSFAAALVSAAMRLLRMGHGDAQSILRLSHALIEQAVNEAETIRWAELCPFAPQLDLAIARHEHSQVRLFGS